MHVYSLTNENIESILTVTDRYIKDTKLPKKAQMQLRLSFEEILIKNQKKFGNASEVKFDIKEKSGKAKIVFYFAGPEFDPFSQENDQDDEERFILYNVISKMENIPIWRYADGENIIETNLKLPKMGMTASICIAITAAVVSGLLSKFLPAEVLVYLTDNILSPVNNAFIGLLCAFATPMVFFSVLDGICEVGDKTAFGKIGKYVLLRYLVMMFAIIAFASLFTLPFFSFAKTSRINGSGDFFVEFLKIFLGIVPGNILQSFLDGNSLQYIFIAIMIGIALINMGEMGRSITEAIRKCNHLFTSIMNNIAVILPFYIFICIFKMFSGDAFRSTTSLLKILILISLLYIPVIVLYIIILRIKAKIPFGTSLKYLMPGSLIALATASSAVAFSTCKKNCIEGMNVPEKIVNFALPLGQALFNPNDGVAYFCLTIGMAVIGGVEITPLLFAIILIQSVLLGMATGPVYGIALIIFSMLFRQIGMPEELLSMALPILVLLDFPMTGMKMFCLQAELVLMGNDYERKFAKN